MILKLEDPGERSRVLARARVLAGSAEQYLAGEWLSRSDVYCVAQENEAHGFHHESGSLARAFACFPSAMWSAVEVVEADRLYDPVLVDDPISHLTAGAVQPHFGNYYAGRGFMLFAMDYDAVILYSPEYEYKLISGTAEFVRAYIDGAEVDPVTELEVWLRGEADMWEQRGDSEHAAAILRALDMALVQVKLPPPDDDL